MKHLLIIIIATTLLLCSCSKNNNDNTPVITEYAGYVIITNGDTVDDLSIITDTNARPLQIIKPRQSGSKIGCRESSAKLFYSWSSNPGIICDKTIYFKGMNPTQTLQITITK
jgi:hypothetical protein